MHALSAWSELSTGGRVFWLVLPFLFLFCAGTALGQSSPDADSTAWRPYQVGFSAADFVAVLNGPAAPEQYQIYGRYRLTRDWTLRTAARYRQLFAEDDRLELAVRIGADRVLRDGKRLQLYIGLDAIGGYDRSFGEDRTYRIGGAPLFGMLVFVTDYLSFSVEPRLVGLYSSFDNPAPSPDADEWTVGLKGNNLLIVSLHF